MQGNARIFIEKGLWVKIGGLNVEYIICFPERTEIGPLFSVSRKGRLFHPVVVKVNSYKIMKLTSFFCCETSYVILLQEVAVLKVVKAQEMRR